MLDGALSFLDEPGLGELALLHTFFQVFDGVVVTRLQGGIDRLDVLLVVGFLDSQTFNQIETAGQVQHQLGSTFLRVSRHGEFDQGVVEAHQASNHDLEHLAMIHEGGSSDDRGDGLVGEVLAGDGVLGPGGATGALTGEVLLDQLGNVGVAGVGLDRADGDTFDQVFVGLHVGAFIPGLFRSDQQGIEKNTGTDSGTQIGEESQLFIDGDLILFAELHHVFL